MIKAVIFDMDGLMFDTEKLWIEEGTVLAQKLGYDIPDDLFYKTIGMKNEDASKLFNEVLGYDFPFLSFRKIYHRCIDQKLKFEKIHEKLGLRELLVYLKNNKYKIAIASSNKRNRINLYLKSANINPSFFDVIISGDDVKRGKPSPEIFQMACNLLRVKPDNTLVLEDSINGAYAALNSGCHLIIIPDMIEIPASLANLADSKEESLMNVIDILNKQNKPI